MTQVRKSFRQAVHEGPDHIRDPEQTKRTIGTSTIKVSPDVFVVSLTLSSHSRSWVTDRNLIDFSLIVLRHLVFGIDGYLLDL